MKTPPPSSPVSRRRFIAQLSAGTALALVPRSVHALDRPSPGKKFGVALVGLGSYSTYQLGPALRQTEHCRLTGVVTGDRAKGLKWARDYGFSEKNIFSYDTMAQLAGNPDIDIVYVVTPNGLHAEHSIAAAKAGKHVICEKPMANTVAECDAIIAACRAAGVQLMIGYRLHFEPHHLEFARIGREQEFGPMMRMKGGNGFRLDRQNWRLNARLAGGGPQMDMGVYVVQAVCMAKGELAPVAATARFGPVTRPKLYSEVEESVSWTLEYADGATADGQASYAENLSWFRAEGPRGWVQIERFDYSGQKLTTSKGSRQFKPVNHQAAQMDGMAECLLTGRPSPVPGEMGRRDLAINEAIYAAARSGRRESVKV
jgi:glucose-fructose oxidoreductase